MKMNKAYKRYPPCQTNTIERKRERERVKTMYFEFSLEESKENIAMVNNTRAKPSKEN